MKTEKLQILVSNMRWIIFSSLLITVLFSSCSLDKLVEKRGTKNYANAPYDAVIIPGYPFRASSHPELFNIRIHFAKALYDKGIARNIIFSGAAVHTPYNEGDLMKLYADCLGIPPQYIFAENEARHSNQNLVKGKKLAKKLGFKKIAVATDPFQFSYLTLLVDIYTPGLPLLTFPIDSMGVYSLPLPQVETESARVENAN